MSSFLPILWSNEEKVVKDGEPKLIKARGISCDVCSVVLKFKIYPLICCSN